MRTDKINKRRLFFSAFTAFLVVVFIISFAGVIRLSSIKIESGVGDAVAAPSTDANGYPPSFADLAEKLKPSVVNISTTKVITSPGYKSFEESPFKGSPFEDFFGDEFFRRFFGDRRGRTYKQRSLGSGFIISEEGYIFTNNHVIEKASEIVVKLSDGKEYEATVKGRDKNTDIALLKIEPKEDLPVANLGISSKLRVGEWVVAIGNPFGLSQTVTVGIVSAKGRVIGAGPYDDFIQTDASINPGNSGGPLFNVRGEVVGINTAIIARGQGIGFAIPIDMAKEILPHLKEKGKVMRGWLGVSVQDINEEIAKSLSLQSREGALVSDVFPGDPADKAGIRTGDVIREIDGKEIKGTHDLLRVVASIPVGRKIKIEVTRNGETKTFSVTVTERKEETVLAESEEGKQYFGITVQAITDELAQHLDLPGKDGVIVTEVKEGSPAAMAGLQSKDVILQVDRTRIRGIEDYRKLMSKKTETSNVLLLIQRGRAKYFVVVRGQ